MAEFNRTQNSTRTFMFGVGSKVLAIIGPFVTRTIIIYKLGNAYVGLSSLFTSVLSILNISELGIGSAITFCLYKPVAEDDKDTIRALLALLRTLYRLIGGIILLLGLSLIPILPKMIKDDIPLDINIYVLYIIYIINATASYLGFAYKGVLLNVYQRGDITHKIEAIAEVLKSVFQVLVLIIFKNYYWFAAILPLYTITVTLSNQIVSKRLFPDLYPFGKTSDEVKRTVRNKVLFLSVHSIAATLTNSVDNIVISGAIGLTAIALYGNYNYIASSVLAILLIAYRALLPAIGNSLVTKSKEDNTKLFNAILFMCFWIIAFCCSSLSCLFQPFIKIWLGESNLLSLPVVIMITAYFFSNATRQLFGSYVAAAGLWNKTLPRQIISAILNLVLDLIFVKKYGIAGIVFSSFFTNTVLSLPMDIYVTYKFILNEKVMRGYISSFYYTIATIILCIITYMTCSFIKCNGILELILKAIVCLILPNIFVVLFSYKSQNYRYIKEHLFSMIKR